MFSPYQAKLIERKKNEARVLYKQGLSLRQVGKVIGRSHEWVRGAVCPEVVKKANSQIGSWLFSRSRKSP